jgi:hypothetical protein
MADRPDKANNRNFSSQVNHIIKQISLCRGCYKNCSLWIGPRKTLRRNDDSRFVRVTAISVNEFFFERGRCTGIPRQFLYKS